jgi:hypothetical protein
MAGKGVQSTLAVTTRSESIFMALKNLDNLNRNSEGLPRGLLRGSSIAMVID